MEVFIEGTILGSLQVLEVYEYYDVPRLFAAINETGSVFLVLWTESTGTADEYYVQPVSFHRFRAVRNGETSLRDAFLRAESAGLVALQIDRQSDEVQIRALSNDQIDKSLLPLDGEVLNLESPLPFARLKEEGERRHIIEISLSSQLSFAGLGKLFESFERLVNAVASKTYGRPRQSLPLSIAFVSVGSFVVDAALPLPEDEEEAGAQAHVLGLVMGALSNPESLLEYSAGDAAFRSFAQAVLKWTDGVRVSWSAPRTEASQSIQFTREDAEAAWGRLQVAAIGPPRIEVTERDRSVSATVRDLITEAQLKTGFLIAVFKAVDLERNSFAAYDAHRDRIFRGSIGINARSTMETITLGVPYLVRVSLPRRSASVLLEVQPAATR